MEIYRWCIVADILHCVSVPYTFEDKKNQFAKIEIKTKKKKPAKLIVTDDHREKKRFCTEVQLTKNKKRFKS